MNEIELAEAADDIERRHRPEWSRNRQQPYRIQYKFSGEKMSEREAEILQAELDRRGVYGQVVIDWCHPSQPYRTVAYR